MSLVCILKCDCIETQKDAVSCMLVVLSSKNRIKKAEELDHLGIFNDNKESIKIIEWPDLIQIPLDNKLEIYLKYVKNENEREIEFVGLNKWASFANEL